MSVKERHLDEASRQKARASYQELYRRALPGSGGIEAERIEVASFNCSENFEEFRQVGLGLETVVIFREGSGEGHTGKVLMNLPGQLLPEHSHVDTIVLRQGAQIAPGFVRLAERINRFAGIKKYNCDASVATDANGNVAYLYRDGEYRIVQAEDGSGGYPAECADDVVALFPGKSETFKAIYGDGILFSDTAQVIHAPPGIDSYAVPAELLPLVGKVRSEQVITTQRMIHLAKGSCVLLAKNTRHAFLAGLDGCVYLEFSTPSMDEADWFADGRVIR